MRPVFPWFLPPAILVAALGLRAARHLKAGGMVRSQARWMLVIGFSPTIFWLLAQIVSRLGDLL